MNPMMSGAAALGRVLLSAIFLFSAYGKITNPAGTKSYIAAAGLPMPDVAYWIAVVVEALGGVLLLVGFQARAAAAVLAVFTLAAALGFHTNFGDRNQWIHFMKNIAICGGLLQVVAFGAGAFGLDGRGRGTRRI